MKKQDFENLAESIRQAGHIRRGEAKPSRVTEFNEVDVKAIRSQLGKSQSEFAHDRGERLDLAELGTGPEAPRRSGPRPAAGRGGESGGGGGGVGELA